MKIKRVVMCLNTSGIAGRAMLRGASSYARFHRDWTCNIRHPDESLFETVMKWEPAGVILESWSRPWAKRFRRAGVASVEVGPAVTRAKTVQVQASVGIDSLAIGEMAAKYYLGRGYRNFAFVGLERSSAELDRETGFRSTVEAAGFRCGAYYVIDSMARSSVPVEMDRAMGRWLSELPKPVGVFAANDGRGLQVLEVAHQFELNAPDDYAVIGADDDEVLCEAIHPPLSSVALPWEQVGHQAASLLDRIMNDATSSPNTIFLPPVRVITRQSSDVLAIHDEDLAAAVRFIRQHASQPIQVEDVIRQINLSRRSLERRCKLTLGHTLLDEIHAAHIEAAKQLLIHTDLAMPQVATRSGFSDERRLWSAFKSKMKINPSDFRRQFRLR